MTGSAGTAMDVVLIGESYIKGRGFGGGGVLRTILPDPSGFVWKRWDVVKYEVPALLEENKDFGKFWKKLVVMRGLVGGFLASLNGSWGGFGGPWRALWSSWGVTGELSGCL